MIFSSYYFTIVFDGNFSMLKLFDLSDTKREAENFTEWIGTCNGNNKIFVKFYIQNKF